jgi:AraC-like DNA-binding protein
VIALEEIVSTQIRTVPALSVIEIADVIISEGLGSRKELEDLKLSFYQPEISNINHSSLGNMRVPEHELIIIWDYLANTLKRPDIGLVLSMRIKGEEYRGPLAKLILYSESVAQALDIFLSRQKWANPGDSWRISHSQENNGAVTLRYQTEKENDYPHAFVEQNMSMLISWIRKMTEQHIRPLKANFTFPRPIYYDKYLSIFGEHCQFNSPENSMTFTSELLKHKNVNYDPYLFTLLRNNHDNLINKGDAEFQVVSRVKQEILSSLPSILTIDAVSEKLNMSRSSLYRRLKENGTSYSDILKELRMRLARTHLTNGLSITQVSYSIGFTDTSAFQKWFKSCFEQAPSILKRKWTNPIQANAPMQNQELFNAQYNR